MTTYIDSTEPILIRSYHTITIGAHFFSYLLVSPWRIAYTYRTYVHTCIPTYLLGTCIYLPTYLPTYNYVYIPTYMFMNLPNYTYLPTYIPVYVRSWEHAKSMWNQMSKKSMWISGGNSNVKNKYVKNKYAKKLWHTYKHTSIQTYIQTPQ